MLAARTLAIALASLLLMAASTKSHALNSINGFIKFGLTLPNAFKGYPVPTRESLLANAPFRERALCNRRLYDPRPDACVQDLHHMERGFEKTYPDAPRDALTSWSFHVAMVHFPHLYLCTVRHRINENLEPIETANYHLTPIPQRIYVGDLDFDAYNRLPQAVRSLQLATAELIWMSYRGFRPAMLELLKLDDRSRIARLTWRFKCYLLMSVIEADIKDPLINALRPQIEAHLTPPTIQELKARAKKRKWPRSERMVTD